MIDNHDIFALPRHFVVISTLGEMEMVCTALNTRPGSSCALVSEPDAGCFMGIAWWKALTAGAGMPAFLDCGMAAARAAEGLRAGLGGVIVEPACTQHDALAQLAGIMGATCLRGRPDAHVIAGPDAADALQRYLRSHPAG
ncbi:hypothetical protein [Novacetimonas pomaceti]|uniref:Uncharacterized protein n=1 Tax=Novacetimonas pomaceti TaxID=2021998 RepID=A0A318QC81_9PROT|nr:hypothetical protein [Novacetimonas pomaceti]PYD76170.1 hypothetical protein CFR71_04720 [Novacetimonas pomaceti]